jgi:uncharacterized membrane protein (UPF0127 family)
MSNKTLKNQPNEIKSAPSPKKHVPVARSPKRLLLAILVILFGAYILVGGITNLLDNKSRLVAPSGTVSIEIVYSAEERQLGLSDRPSIGDDEGMLFVFDEAALNNCFWMKDMQFPIDMVWLDEDKKVITVIESVDPSTYPESFCPESLAKYGLELQSAQAKVLGIEPGEKLRF